MAGRLTFLLDTNICSAYMRRPGQLAHRFVQHFDQLAIPSLVLAELYAGACRHSNSARLLALIGDLTAAIPVLDFDATSARHFGEIRGMLLKQGVATSPVDLMIAAVALQHDLTLVTNNTSDFATIPDLRLVDWLAP